MTILLSPEQRLEEQWARVEPGSTPPDDSLVDPDVARRMLGSGDVKRLAIEVGGDVLPEDYADLLPKVAMVAIRFPKFADGRGFTVARELREHYGYRGEIRACGEFIPDQMQYLARCGFDVFEISDESRIAHYEKALADFTKAYQRLPGDERLRLAHRLPLNST